MRIDLKNWLPTAFDVRKEGPQVLHIQGTPHYRWKILKGDRVELQRYSRYPSPLAKALVAMTKQLSAAESVNHEDLKTLHTYVHLKVDRYNAKHGWVYKFLFARRLADTVREFDTIVTEKLQAVSPDSPPSHIEDAPNIPFVAPSHGQLEASLMGTSTCASPSPQLPIDWSVILNDRLKGITILRDSCTIPYHFINHEDLFLALIREESRQPFINGIVELFGKHVGSTHHVLPSISGLLDAFEKQIPCERRQMGPLNARVPIASDWGLGVSCPDLLFEYMRMLFLQIQQYRLRPIFSPEYIHDFHSVREWALLHALRGKRTSLKPDENNVLEWLQALDEMLFPSEGETTHLARRVRDQKMLETFRPYQLSIATKLLSIPGAEKAYRGLYKALLLQRAPNPRRTALGALRIVFPSLNLLSSYPSRPDTSGSMRAAIRDSQSMLSYMVQVRNASEAAQQIREFYARPNTKIWVEAKENFFRHVFIPLISTIIDQIPFYYIISCLSCYEKTLEARLKWTSTPDTPDAIRNKKAYEDAKQAFYQAFLTAAKQFYIILEKSELLRQFFTLLDEKLKSYAFPLDHYDLTDDFLQKVVFPLIEEMVKTPSLFSHL